MEYDAKYADFLIWYEIRHRMRDAKERSLIFLSNDQKEDWWQDDNGKLIGPRPELHAELAHRSNVEMFTIYTVERFLQLVKDSNLLSVADNTISEVAETAVHISQPKDDVSAPSMAAILKYMSTYRKAEDGFDTEQFWRHVALNRVFAAKKRSRKASIMQMFRERLNEFGGPQVHLKIDRYTTGDPSIDDLIGNIEDIPGAYVASLFIPNEQGGAPTSYEIRIDTEQARELRELGASWDGPAALDPALR